MDVASEKKPVGGGVSSSTSATADDATTEQHSLEIAKSKTSIGERDHLRSTARRLSQKKNKGHNALAPNGTQEDDDESQQHAIERLPSLSLIQSRVDPPQSLAKEILFITVVCAAQFMTQAGLALGIVPLHIIGESLQIQDAGTLSWFAAGYSLTVGTFILIAGRLGDVYGHRLLFLIGFVWFGVWSLLAGFSVWASPIFFICCRALQGVGPALLLPNALAIFGQTYEPGPRKNMVFSVFGANAPSGFVLSGMFTALLSERVWWPWAYWVMGIACFIFAVAGLLFIPKTPAPIFSDGLSAWTRLDLTGSILGVSGLVLINVAWNQGPVVGWTTPYTYTILIIGCAIFAAFVIIELRVAAPLLPRAIFTEETGFVLGCIVAGWSSFGIFTYYGYQLLQILRGESALLSVVQFIPCTIAGAIAAILTGLYLARAGPAIFMLIAMTAFTVGTILLATVPVGQIYWAQTFLAICIMPFGMDMSFPSGTIILSNAMPKEHQGVAASLVMTVVNYSISIGLGLAGTVESHVNRQGTDLLRGYRGAWYLGIGLSGMGMALAFTFVAAGYIRTSRKERSEEVMEDIERDQSVKEKY
ncbi:hypothetical protein MMC25_004542 [Agyrium rufum]|nr:hypothetical protein [Agyrium rufum]